MQVHGRRAAATALWLGLCLATSAKAGAQAVVPPGTAPENAQHRGRAGMGRVAGEVVTVSGASLKVKGEDGRITEVVTTDNTRLMKDRGPVRLGDLHPGDGLMAIGNLDPATGALHAAMVFAEDAAEVKAMRDNLGKTYITGRVKAVDMDNARATVERADHKDQTIGFDEGTSFRRAVRGSGGNGGEGGSGSGGEGEGRGPAGGRGFGGGMAMGGMALSGAMDRAFNNGESITLADIRPGDFLSGTGTVKNGMFVPARVLDVPAGMRRSRGTAPGAAGNGGTPDPGSR